MDLSISVVNWNTKTLLDQCLSSVYDTTHGMEFEVIVVDNASSDGSVEMVRQKHPHVRLIENTDNRGFAAANNQAYGVSAGRYFLLLNPDTICRPGTLTVLASFLDRNPKAGAVTSLVLNANLELEYSWSRFPTFLSEALGKLDRRIGPDGWCPRDAEELRLNGRFRADWIGGCCLMIRRDAVEEIGLMDESFFMYCEETDWCFRLHRAGWEVWVEPSAEIVHLVGRSSLQVAGSSAFRLRESKALFFAKHHGRTAGAALGAVLAVRHHVGLLLRGSRGAHRGREQRVTTE